MLHKMLQATFGLLILGHVLLGLAAIGQSTFEEILPQDVASRSEERVVIKCRLAYQNIAWTFCPKDGSQPHLVAFDCKVLQSSQDRFDTDMTNDACHLIIKVASRRLAGTYTCQDSYSDDYGYSAEFRITDNENLALNKNATQSSTYTDGNLVGLASKAVDGVADDFVLIKTCTHTNNELPAWWAVDLGQKTPVVRVRITNRNHPAVVDRLSNFYIGLTNVSPWTSAPNLATSSICKFIAGYPPGGVPTDYICDPGTAPGRYLFVLLKNQNFLTICELEAYYS